MPHRIRVRRRRSRMSGGSVASAIGVGIALAVISAHGAAPASGATASGAPDKAAAAAIAYAQRQIGKPYLWGGTGPDAFDCSGLVFMAYGKSIARTSQDQYASEPHVSTPEPGDLVFFVGSDGTVTSPGHVGLVTGPHQMIEAYATGYPVRVSTFGLASSPAGDQNPVGFTQPRGGA